MENEEDLHALWASLLATALDEKGNEVHRKFVSILGDLTSADASILKLMWTDWLAVNKEETMWQSPTVSYGPGISGTETHNQASVITLNRLGLISPNDTKIRTYLPPGHDGDRGDTWPHEDLAIVHGDLMVVVFTPLGEGFCTAVIGPELDFSKD